MDLRKKASYLVIAAGFALFVIVASLGVTVPFWLDVARVDAIVLIVFGGVATLAVSPGPNVVYRGTFFLLVAAAVQCAFAAVVAVQGPNCGSAASDLSYAFLFAVIGALGYPIATICMLVIAPFFVFAVSRTALIVRIVAVTAFLIVAGMATFFVAQHMALTEVHRCAAL